MSDEGWVILILILCGGGMVSLLFSVLLHAASIMTFLFMFFATLASFWFFGSRIYQNRKR